MDFLHELLGRVPLVPLGHHGGHRGRLRDAGMPSPLSLIHILVMLTHLPTTPTLPHSFSPLVSHAVRAQLHVHHRAWRGPHGAPGEKSSIIRRRSSHVSLSSPPVNYLCEKTSSTNPLTSMVLFLSLQTQPLAAWDIAYRAFKNLPWVRMSIFPAVLFSTYIAG